MGKLKIGIIFGIFMGLTSCRDADDTPMRTPNLQAPIVTGLYVTNDFVTLETWREPSSGGNIGVFPSITSMRCATRFILPETGSATVWITSAYLKNGNLLNSLGAGQFANIPGVAVWTYSEQNYSGGVLNSVQWDLKDDQGNKVKPGFYRVFVQTDDDVLFTDMFVYHDCSDIPHDIKTHICN
ncbi:hypothetical protein JNM05_03785 [bacterium]|nr:hypothetical protein [bacterium]